MLDYSVEAIAERMKNGLKQPSNRIEGGFVMDNIQALSEELSRLIHEGMLRCIDDVMLDTAEGYMLDRKAAEFAEKRKPATCATVDVEFSGKINAVIPGGTIVATEDNIEFETEETVMINQEGTATVKAKCISEGTIGNVNGNAISIIKSYLSDVEKVVNKLPASGGNDEENDDTFRKRIIEKIKTPIMSGNKNHYIYWAKQVSGIGEARVIACPGGVAGTVEVIILSSQQDVPGDDVVARTKSHIEENRPIGAAVTVTKAIPKLVTVNATISINSDASLESIKTRITSDIEGYLKSIAFKQDVLSYFKIGDIIYSTAGVSDITNYTLNDANESLTAEFKEFFKIEAVIINAN